MADRKGESTKGPTEVGTVPAETMPIEKMLEGIFPVLCTPFDERGAIDLKSLDALVEFTLESGADGITIGGVASEVMKLGDGERRSIVEHVLARVDGRAPVWVGTGHQSTDLAIEHSLHAQSGGAAGVMVMPPFVQKPSLASLAGFFHELNRALALPIMIQDAPQVSALTLPVEWLAKFDRDCANVRAVKVEAPPTGPKIAELTELSKGQLRLFGGLGGANFVGELRRGAVGTLPGAAFPEAFVRILEHWRTGDTAAAQADHARVLPLIRFASQSVEWSYHAYKRILVKRGVLKTAVVRRPTCRFDDVAQQELEELMAACGIATD
jgi:dihydrodipicolinate synthase/N-acetylneuraminate lyase